MDLKTKIEFRQKFTNLAYGNEDKPVFLINFMHECFCDHGYDEKDITNLAVISEILSEYGDTGGSEAGEYCHAWPNFLHYVREHYDFLRDGYMYKMKNGLTHRDFYAYLVWQYQDYINWMAPEPKWVITK